MIAIPILRKVGRLKVIHTPELRRVSVQAFARGTGLAGVEDRMMIEKISLIGKDGALCDANTERRPQRIRIVP